MIIGRIIAESLNVTFCDPNNARIMDLSILYSAQATGQTVRGNEKNKLWKTIFTVISSFFGGYFPDGNHDTYLRSWERVEQLLSILLGSENCDLCWIRLLEEQGLKLRVFHNQSNYSYSVSQCSVMFCFIWSHTFREILSTVRFHSYLETSTSSCQQWRSRTDGRRLSIRIHGI